MRPRLTPLHLSSFEEMVAARNETRVGLTPAIVAWRAGHAVIAAGFTASIAYVWWSAVTRRRGPLLRPAVAALAVEGALVGLNRGDCPLGRLGDRIGDPVPLFELVLSPRAAKLAVPVLGAVTAAGFALLAARPPQTPPPPPPPPPTG